MKYIDIDGFCHHAPLIKSPRDPQGFETSENGPLFTAILRSLKVNDRVAHYYKLRKDKRTFRATPISTYKESHFSYDNMLGFYYLYDRNHLNMAGLPIWWWWSENKPYVNLESVFFYYLQNKETIFKGLIFWYLKKAMRRSLAKPYADTNGKQKWWLRCQMLPPEFLREATYLIDGMYSSSWLGVFSVYYTHQRDHPIIQAAMKRFMK